MNTPVADLERLEVQEAGAAADPQALPRRCARRRRQIARRISTFSCRRRAW